MSYEPKPNPFLKWSIVAVLACSLVVVGCWIACIWSSSSETVLLVEKIFWTAFAIATPSVLVFLFSYCYEANL